MRMIKFRAKRVNGGEWVKSMTISYGTIKRKMYNVLFHKGMFCYKNKACGFTPLWYVSDRCEVIGNAFDNPELMKEGVQP
jgi:hypothetical protein